ncbi:hypothetical protein GDO81_019905 [Engystomops pustulosus]|uniref:Uncharacterized protein n=1 Tax=Engystomops pustulosus TaxID=76066 RepID=A0AAV6YYG7_ENGPU|nr:hypothetical protein GDO81_019905 [Engystomops pustulosus]
MGCAGHQDHIASEADDIQLSFHARAYCGGSVPPSAVLLLCFTGGALEFCTGLCSLCPCYKPSMQKVYTYSMQTLPLILAARQ